MFNFGAAQVPSFPRVHVGVRTVRPVESDWGTLTYTHELQTLVASRLHTGWGEGEFLLPRRHCWQVNPKLKTTHKNISTMTVTLKDEEVHAVK